MVFAALSPEERKGLLLSVGTHRAARALTPVEVGELLGRAIRAGDTMAECAEAVHLDGTSQVGRFVALLKLPPEVRHLVDWGKSDETLAFTAAFEIARLASADDQVRTAQAVLSHGLSTGEVRQVVQARKRSGTDIEQCITSIIGMRPTVDVHHVFLGKITDGALTTRLSALSQAERDGLMKATLAETFADLKAGGRLGVDRFTLVGGAALGEAVKKKDELERRINDALVHRGSKHD
jgi:hypothetical protein